MTLPSTEIMMEGNLNPRVKGLRPSTTLAMNEKAARLRKEGRQVYQLGFGQSPFPVPSPVIESLRTNAFQKDYLPVRGLPQLREAVARYHRRFNQVEANDSDVLIGPGSKELIFLLQLTFDGDLVIPSPSWVSYEPQAVLAGRRVCWLHTRKEDGWRLTGEQLEELCRADPSRPRLLILNYPNNPTGLTFRDEELKGIARVAREYELLILSDEIYAELNHSATHTSIAKYYPEGTIISSGISKWCGAGGWRLGTFCFPGNLNWLLEAMAVVASETFSAVSAPIQFAAVTAFQQDEEIRHYLAQSRRIIKGLGELVTNRLRAAGADVHDAEGAYYLFPDFEPVREHLRARGINSSSELCQRLLNETGVAMLPGSDFGRPPAELSCRVAYVNFDGTECLKAAEAEPELSTEFFSQYCGSVIEAFEILGGWLR